MREWRIFGAVASPLPHPATHVSILEWVAGWGSGPVQRIFKTVSKLQARSIA